MKEYSASITQSAQTIKRYARMQYSIFHRKVKLAGFAASVALVLIGGFLVEGEGLSLLLIFLGCIMFTNMNAPANFTANRVIALFNGRYPTLKYSFGPDGFGIEGKEKKIKYGSLMRLVEDDEYLYLFQTPQYGSMLKKSSIQGDDGAAGFRRMLENKTGLKWTKPSTFYNFGLKDLRELFPGRDRYQGPRLGS